MMMALPCGSACIIIPYTSWATASFLAPVFAGLLSPSAIFSASGGEILAHQTALTILQQQVYSIGFAVWLRIYVDDFFDWRSFAFDWWRIRCGLLG